MEQLHYPSYTRLLQIIVASFFFHALVLIGLDFVPRQVPQPRLEKVAVRVVPKPSPNPEPLPPQIPKAEPKPKAPPKPSSITEAKPPAETKPVVPVQGLSPDSFSTSGTATMAAPAGNTTMAPDEGKRLTPEEVAKLAKNLSQDAELIANTFERPPYTPEAEDAGLEGRFVVDVYVNEEGLVTSAELRKPIGFGMDQRVLESAKKSRFRPRRDAKGQPVAGWTEIKVRLTID